MSGKKVRSWNIDRNLVSNDYNKLKIISKCYYFYGLYSWAMDVICIAATLMYNFNMFYYDEELELMLKNISKKIMKKKCKPEVYDKNRVVFYDYFSLDNRGLTEQYLQGLIDNDYEILYITLQKKSEKMHNILKKLKYYKNATIYFSMEKRNIAKCNEIVEKIIQFQPSKILYHSAPWDTVGHVVLSFFEGTKIDRFLINLTDHAFWLGRDCVDYFLEFRNYGVNISQKQRSIDKKKLLLLPYYPIQDNEIEFQGFPFDDEGKKVIISAGSLYKIYGRTIFFDIVKYILNKYQDTVFYYLGNGNEDILLNFIQENNFVDRFFYDKERKDINKIIKQCYFYLGTYPIAGGLISQLAVANNKIPVMFTEKKYPMNNMDEIFINNDNEFMLYSLEDVYNKIAKLMGDNEYYTQKTSRLENKVISVSDFSKLLFFALENKKSVYTTKNYEIDIDEFSQIYFDQENNYLHNYENYFFIVRNPLIFIMFTKYTIRKIYKKIFSLCRK